MSVSQGPRFRRSRLGRWKPLSDFYDPPRFLANSLYFVLAWELFILLLVCVPGILGSYTLTDFEMRVRALETRVEELEDIPVVSWHDPVDLGMSELPEPITFIKIGIEE